MDALGWEFHVSTLDDSNITEPPKVSDACSCLRQLYTALLD